MHDADDEQIVHRMKFKLSSAATSLFDADGTQNKLDI